MIFLVDDDSKALLSSLVARKGFDEDCLRFEVAKYCTSEEKSAKNHYQCFGGRLAELYDEVQNPTPRGWLLAWMERNSKARNVMLTTLVGVMIAP